MPAIGADVVEGISKIVIDALTITLHLKVIWLNERFSCTVFQSLTPRKIN